MNLPGYLARVGSRRNIRVAAAGFLIVVIGSAWLLAGSGSFSLEALEALLRAHPIFAPLLFVAAHVIAAIAFIPCSPFTLLAGFLWPQPYGLLLSITAALASSCATFLLTRYFWTAQLRPEFVDGPLKPLLELSSKHGWSMVAFAHLNPALPSSTLGYAFGLSAIPFRVYVLSALLAMLPLQIALVMLGRAARQVLLSGVWMAAGASLAIALMALGLWLILRNSSAGRAKEGQNDDGNT